MKPFPLRVLLIISLTFLAQLVAGQSRQIDSLQRLIDREKDSKRKVELLNAMTYHYFDLDIEKANTTSQQALETAQRIGDKRSEGWAAAYRGLYFFFSGALPEAQSHFHQALSIGRTEQDNNLQTYSLTQLANVNRDRGSFDSALTFYRLAEKSSLVNVDKYYQSVVKMNEGRLFLAIHKPDSALLAISKALHLREELKDSLRIVDAWILMGNCYREKGDFKLAEKYYQKARPYSLRDSFIYVDYTKNMGEIYFLNGDFQKALENWSKVLTFHRKYQYQYALAELLLRMGTAFEQQGFFDLAIEYFTNAMKIAEKSSFQYLLGEILHEQSWVSYRARNLELASLYNHKAMGIFRKINAELELAGCWDLRGLIMKRRKNFDSSYYYHKKSLDERMRIGNKVDLSSSLFNTGDFFIETGQFKTALPYLHRGLAIDNALGDNYGRSLYYNRIGKLYTEISVFDSARYYLEKSMALAIPTSANEIFRDNYIDLASYFEKIGKPQEALKYYKKYTSLSDSIFGKETAQSLASYRTLYDVERNEQKIELLNKDNELSKALVQKQKAILYSAIAGSLIFFALAGFYFRFSRKLSKLNKEIAEQKEEIQAQAEELTESNLTISGINEKLEERIDARTSELKQAFKELDTFFYRSSHDFRRPLTTFMGLAEVARVLVKDPAALELFEKVNENAMNLDKMLRKLQSVSDVDMQTLIYKEVSVKEIFEIELSDLKKELDSKKIRTTLSVKLEHPFYSYGALIKIIVQNLLENSIAFSTTSSPMISLSAYEIDGEVVIEVKDNGHGIEPEYIERVFEMYFRASEHSKGNGLGLYIVKKTIQKLNGRVELHSETGKGTTVRVFFPQRLD